MDLSLVLPRLGGFDGPPFPGESHIPTLILGILEGSVIVLQNNLCEDTIPASSIKLLRGWERWKTSSQSATTRRHIDQNNNIWIGQLKYVPLNYIIIYWFSSSKQNGILQCSPETPEPTSLQLCLHELYHHQTNANNVYKTSAHPLCLHFQTVSLQLQWRYHISTAASISKQ